MCINIATNYMGEEDKLPNITDSSGNQSSIEMLVDNKNEMSLDIEIKGLSFTSQSFKIDIFVKNIVMCNTIDNENVKPIETKIIGGGEITHNDTHINVPENNKLLTTTAGDDGDENINDSKFKHIIDNIYKNSNIDDCETRGHFSNWESHTVLDELIDDTSTIYSESSYNSSSASSYIVTDEDDISYDGNGANFLENNHDLISVYSSENENDNENDNENEENEENDNDDLIKINSQDIEYNSLKKLSIKNNLEINGDSIKLNNLNHLNEKSLENNISNVVNKISNNKKKLFNNFLIQNDIHS
jgi:hypothetical protein